MENIDPLEFREITVRENVICTFWLSAAAGLIMYIISSAIANVLILGYAYIMGVPSVTIDRSILITPVIIGVITIGVCLTVSLINSVLYRYTSKPETNEKKE